MASMQELIERWKRYAHSHINAKEAGSVRVNPQDLLKLCELAKAGYNVQQDARVEASLAETLAETHPEVVEKMRAWAKGVDIENAKRLLEANGYTVTKP